MELPSLRQLEYLVALAQHLHFGEAARACNVSQPGLSAQIRQLETILGVPLFERGSRGVRATPAGRRSAELAERVLADVRALASAARAAGETLEGELDLGVIPTIAPFVLPWALTATRERYPGLRCRPRELPTPDLRAALERGALDLGLVALEAPLGRLQAAALFHDPLLVLAPREYALGEPGEPLAREALGQLSPLLLLEDGHCLADQALAVCSRPASAMESALRATSLVTLVEMVAGGFGVTLLPASAVEALGIEGRGLALHPLSPPARRTVGVVWRPADPRAPAFRALVALWREVCPEAGGSVPDSDRC